MKAVSIKEVLFAYLPITVRPLFKELFEDLVELNERWDFYLELFSDPANHQLFDSTAPAAFSLIHSTLISDIIIRICKLTDPEISFRQKNLSLEALVGCFKDHPQINEELEALKKKCEPIKKLRSKLFVHKDFHVSLQPGEFPIPTVNVFKFGGIISTANNLMNLIVHEYKDTEILFNVLNRVGGGDALVHWVKLGLEKSRADRQALLGPPKKNAG